MSRRVCIIYGPQVINNQPFTSSFLSKSIENMFHVSFLVKAGEVGIQIDRCEIPHLVLLKKGEEKTTVAMPAGSLASSTAASSKSKSRKSSEPESKKAKTDNATGRPAQGVVVLTKAVWEDLIDAMGLDKQRGKSIFG